LTAFFSHYLNPTSTVLGHFLGIARERIVDMFILASEYTHIAICAVLNIYDKVPFRHSLISLFVILF
jgi:hypothetical protein